MKVDRPSGDGSHELPDANEKSISTAKFLGPGFLLFLDQLLLAAGGWLYWIMIFRFASASEVGEATTVYSLVLLFSLIVQLGLEYPLLKKSSVTDRRSNILGTALLLELIITVSSLPIMFCVISNISDQSLQVYSWLAAVMLLSSSLGFISRFALLGVSSTKSVLLVDLVAISIKFVSGFTLVALGFGAFGMVTSIFLQLLFTTLGTMMVARKLFSGFSVDNIHFLKEIAIDGLANAPTKVKSLLMLSIAVVLLAHFGVSSSDIGIFYAAFMLSVITGSLSSSISFMVIPASSSSKADLSNEGLRIGLSLTAPLIAALIIEGKFILSVIGTQYMSAEQILLVLSIGILPASIVMNTISKFNNLNKSRKVIIIGSVQIVTFLTSFWCLVPIYGTLGAAFSALISFTVSSIPSILWSERKSIKYIVFSCVAIIVGLVVGFLFSMSLQPIHPFFVVVITVAVTLAVIIILKNITILEIRRLIKVLSSITNNIRR